MIGFVIILLALLVVVAVFMLRMPHCSGNRTKKTDGKPRTQTPEEKRLEDAQLELYRLESDKSIQVAVNHGYADSHAIMRFHQEHEELVDRVREAEKEVYGTPITSEDTDWRLRI